MKIKDDTCSNLQKYVTAQYSTLVALEDQYEWVLDAMIGFKESLVSEGVEKSKLAYIFDDLVQNTLKTY